MKYKLVLYKHVAITQPALLKQGPSTRNNELFPLQGQSVNIWLLLANQRVIFPGQRRNVFRMLFANHLCTDPFAMLNASILQY